MRFTEPINYVSLSTEPAFPTKRYSDYNHGQLHKRKREELILVLGFALPHQFQYQVLKLLSPWPASSLSHVMWFCGKGTSFELTPTWPQIDFDPYKPQDLRQVI